MSKIHCGRCGQGLTEIEAEVCWYCDASLCPGCWDDAGHCGHAEADEINEKMREFYAAVEDDEREHATDEGKAYHGSG